MKLEDLETVNKLQTILTKCRNAQAKCIEIAEYHEDEEYLNSGGIAGHERGYWGAFSIYRDGSGPQADLCGCYVGYEAAMAIHAVLEAKIEQIKSDLIALGVKLEGSE